MINKTHLVKVAVWWTSIVYLICYVGVVIIPGVRPWFLKNALHLSNPSMQSTPTFGNFIFGIIIWNVVAVLAVLLFASLFNCIKK